MAYDIFHNYGFDDESATEERSPVWKVVSTKSVTDIDGWFTDYTWYTDGNQHLFMFGDIDFVDPDIDYADWICETEQEAKEWFDSYNGFTDCDDEDEFDWMLSENKEEFFDKGFQKAYGIIPEDNITLVEAYNNLPDWFKNYLDNGREGESIKRVLSNRGIDLANATYIRGAFPRSNRDPVLKDESRLTVFRLDDGRGDEKIYIVGVNNPYLRIEGWEYKYANELPMKTILAMATEYGYIDINDARNLNKEKRGERAALRRSGPQRGVGQHPVERNIYATDENGRKDWDNVIGTEIEWVTTKGQDKSGYPLDPEKYVIMLDNVGLDTYAARLESYYKKIEFTRSRLIALMSKFDINDSDKYRTHGTFSNNVYSDIAEAMSLLSRAIEAYQKVKNRIGVIIEGHEKEPSNDIVDKRIKSVFSWDGQSIRNYLKDATDLITKIEKTELIPEQD